MPAREKYPQAAATMHPARSPTTTAQDFMIGLPKRSERMIVTKTRNPRPTNSAEPQGSGLGATLLGQSWKGPEVGRLEQVPDPPAQFWKPDLMRLMPISATVGPVTMGGKIFLSHVGLVKDSPISRSAHMAAVPMIAPINHQPQPLRLRPHGFQCCLP